MAIIGVSGATGRLGGRVARRLELAGQSQRLLVRDVARAPSLRDTQAVTASWTDVDALEAALDGLDTVLMVSASEAAERLEQHFRFVDAASQAGVKHLVYTSFVGAAPGAVFTLARDHYATEEHIKASGLAYTFLRDNLYADFLVPMVGQDGVLRGPAGDGRVAAVAQDDIVHVATVVLQAPDEHAGKAYELSGPQALSLSEVARTIAHATGRDVTYQPESVAEAYESRRGYNVPDWELEAWVSTYTAIAAGEMSAVSTDVEAITGRPATSLQELLQTTN